MSAREEFFGGRVVLHAGDCRAVLKDLPDASIDSVVTDPPYALVSIVKRFGGANAKPAQGDVYARAAAGFMGKAWDTGETAFAVEFWAEVFRVLKPGGHVLAFAATRTYHRLTCAIEDAGFEVRDLLSHFVASDTPVLGFLASLNEAQRAAFLCCLEESQFGGLLGWVFASGFPKSHNPGDAYDDRLGWFDEDERERGLCSHYAAHLHQHGTALKPALEPICVARKPLSGTVVENMLAHGTGALNIDGCRIESERLTGWGGHAAGGGSWNEDTCGLHKHGNPRPIQGRWPANVLHDGSDEVLSRFPDTKSFGAPGPAQKNSNSHWAIGGERSSAPGGYLYCDSGSAARFFYSAKADAVDRLGFTHPTVKPVDLMQWLVRLVTPPGGTVLDPFAGTGTTGEAALREGFRAVLVEREPEYRAEIARRMALALANPAERRGAAKRAKAARAGAAPADAGGLFEGLL